MPDIATYEHKLRTFVDGHEGRIRELLDRYSGTVTQPLLSQPEIVVLLERLVIDRHLLRESWISLPLDLLDDVESAWGFDIN